MRKKFMSFALALTMIASLVPTNGVEAAKAKKPVLSQSKLSLEVGSKKTLTLKKAPKLSKKKIKKVKWSSSNSKVVSVLRVNKNKTSATLKGLARGSAIVKVKYNGKTYKCKVTVMETSSTRRNTEVVTEKLTEQEKTTEKSTQKDTEQEKTTEKPSNDTAKPSEEKPTTHVHSYGNWKTVVAATCVKDGSEKRECSCGDKEVRTIKALGHQWDSGKVTKAATYKEAGVKTYTCAACSETKTESIPMLTETEHAWDNGVVTKAATCAEMGVKTYTCKNCGGTKTENIPAKTEHTWNAGITTKAATYTESGIKTYTCTVCGTTKTEAIPMLTETEHKWDAGKITTQPTCTKTGIKTYTCENCGGTKTEILPVLEHTYGEGTVTKEATCAEAGTKTYTCSVCGNVKTEEIATTNNHDYQYKSNLSASATCTEQGSKISVCSVCGKTKTEITDALGHDYDEHHVCVRCQEGDSAVYVKRVDVSNNNANPVYAYYKDTNTTDSSGKKLYDVVVRPAGEANPIKAAAFEDDTTIRDVTFTSETNGGAKYTGGTLRTYLASNASDMFKNCTNLRNVDVSGLCSYNATAMYSFFQGCENLKEVKCSNNNFYLNGNCNSFFDGCNNLTTYPNVITTIGEVTSAASLFKNCSKIKSITLSCYGDMRWTFGYCSSLEEVNVYGQPTSLSYAFYKCTKLNAVKFQNISKVNSLSNCFVNCYALSSINWGTSYNQKNTSFESTFSNCTCLTEINLTPFETHNVTDMSKMFMGCTSLKNLYLKGFDTSNVTNMRDMFSYMIEIKELDLSSFDTSNVTNMYCMFYGSPNLKTIYVTQGKWVTPSSTESTKDMFTGAACSSVTYK